MEYYLPIVAFHILAVLSWMALLFYMPRLFVYHTEHKDKKDFTDIVEIQEEKIFKYIGVPAMLATILSGIAMLILNPDLLKQGWMHAKLFILILMVIYTVSLAKIKEKLKNRIFDKSGQYYRAYNEIPSLYAVLIVTFVITKSIPLYFTIGTIIVFIFMIYKIGIKKV